jgi:hypothetical protein
MEPPSCGSATARKRHALFLTGSEGYGRSGRRAESRGLFPGGDAYKEKKVSYPTGNLEIRDSLLPHGFAGDRKPRNRFSEDATIPDKKIIPVKHR